MATQAQNAEISRVYEMPPVFNWKLRLQTKNSFIFHPHFVSGLIISYSSTHILRSFEYRKIKLAGKYNTHGTIKKTYTKFWLDTPKTYGRRKNIKKGLKQMKCDGVGSI